jgi:hypothetical protein
MQCVSDASRIADRTQDAYLLALVSGMTGVVQQMSGEFKKAAAQLEEGEAKCRVSASAMTWELDIFRFMRLFALREMGSIAELSRSMTELFADAEQRRDLNAEISLGRLFNLFWLARDDAAQARAVLDRPRSQGGRYYDQQILYHWSEVEFALYTDNQVEAARRHRALFAELDHHQDLTVVLPRAVTRCLQGRLALARAHSGDDVSTTLGEAKRRAKALERETVIYPHAWARLLRAGIAAVSGDEAGAVENLKAAIPIAESQNMLLVAAVARRRLGERLGGSEGAALVAEANGWMAKEGIANTERMTRLFAPGLHKM